MNFDQPIGGDHFEGIYKKNINLFFDNKKILWLNSGRSCIDVVIRNLPNNITRIFLPNYICLDTYYKILKKYNFKLFFYSVDEKFTFNLESSLKSNSAIFFVNYFGISSQLNKIKEIKKKYNPIVIYDLVQAPFFFIDKFKNKINKLDFIDYSFTSFKKGFAIPNGACLYAKCSLIQNNLKSSDYIDPLWKKAVKLKKNYLIKKKKNLNSELKYIRAFKIIHNENNKYIMSISKLSFEILNKIDFEKEKQIRRKNYLFFLDKFKKLDLILPKEKLLKYDIPLFLPLFFFRASQKKNLMNILFQNSYYMPSHWSSNRKISKYLDFKEDLSQRELSIIIDNRIKFDRNKISNLIMKTLNEYK